MTVFRTQLKKILAVRNELDASKIKLGKLKNDLMISNIKELEAPKGTKADKKAIVFEYTMKAEYGLEEPKGKSFGTIEIVGDIIDVEDDKLAKEILDTWKKSKKINPDIMEVILNIAFEESNIEAIYQSKKVGLPPPLPLPRLRTQQPDAKSS